MKYYYVIDKIWSTTCSFTLLIMVSNDFSYNILFNRDMFPIKKWLTTDKY